MGKTKSNRVFKACECTKILLQNTLGSQDFSWFSVCNITSVSVVFSIHPRDKKNRVLTIPGNLVDMDMGKIKKIPQFITRRSIDTVVKNRSMGFCIYAY